MNAWLRRAAVFALVFGAGMGAVVATSGGLFLEIPAAPRWTTEPVDLGTGDLAPLRPGTSIGAGSGGHLERTAKAVVGDRLVQFLELVAEWDTATPVKAKENDVTLQRLTGARLVFFPRPTDEEPVPAANETAPGVTILSGREALLRRKEGAPPSARTEGDCVASHFLDDGETLVLRSEALDLRREERAKEPHHVVESDRAVRIEGGGSVLEGTGLHAEFGATRRGRGLLRVERDVAGRFLQREGESVTDVAVRCAGAADLESIERAGRDASQPWRATFRDDVRVEDGRTKSVMTAEHVVVEFLRTGRSGSDGGTTLRRLDATGGVVVDGAAPADGATPSAAYRAQAQELRQSQEDPLTVVTVLTGAPVLGFRGRPVNAAATAPPSEYDVRCSGPVTIRERRTAAGKDAPSIVTIVFEGGDVVAKETVAGTGALRSEVRAPRITIEAGRSAKGTDPQILRAEQGATARWEGLGAEAQTITAVAADPTRPGSMQKVALVGKPVARYALRAGASPLGGAEDAGRLVLSSDSRIDVELAPDRPAAERVGPRATAKVAGGMRARKIVGEKETWVLTAREGDARIGWDDTIEEMHARGDARLRGSDDPSVQKDGDLRGETIAVRRAAAAPAAPGAKDDAWRRLDVQVDGTDAAPAVALLSDRVAGQKDRDALSHRIRARQLVQTQDGTVLNARGAVRAELHRRPAEKGRVESTLSLDCDELRADVERREDGRASPRVLHASGNVLLSEATYKLRGQRVVYDVVRGEAEAAGAPVAKITRTEGEFESYAQGSVIRAWFTPGAAASQAFQRALLPHGGELVAYFADPDRRKVVTTCKGPLEMTRTSASFVSQVVAVFETRLTPTSGWLNDARIDCQRLDMTFDPDAAQAPGAARSERIRSLLAQGTADTPAEIWTRNPSGQREVRAQAERIEAAQSRSTLFLSCPSGRSTVYFHDLSTGQRLRCDRATFDFRTYEWFDLLHARFLE